MGVAAHDLRTPISIIQMYSKFINDSLREDQSELKEFTSLIEKSAHFMTGLINDVLDFSKMESGNISVHFGKYNIEYLISRIVKLNQHIAFQKNIKINLVIRLKETKELVFDENKIEQVLNNILSNAIKYSPINSETKVIVSEKKKSIQIEVIDQGPGIPADEIKHLYQPFETASSKATGGEKSTGIGLVIVNNILLAHHSRLNVESIVGKGSNFYFFLPKNLALPEETDKDIPEIKCCYRILLAEDDIILQKAMTRFLEKLEHQVTVVNNGIEAVNTYDKNDFDLVLMDFNMPEMNGLEASIKIKERFPDALIIGLTGEEGADAIKKAQDAKMKTCISKPLTKITFDRMVYQFLMS